MTGRGLRVILVIAVLAMIAPQKGGAMTARDLRARLQEEASRKLAWKMDWEKTCDQFLAGNPDVEIRGIAVSWMSTQQILERARERGANLLVTHEPLYVLEADPEKGIPADHPWVRKKRWLEQVGMVVYRCHDFWDDFPEIGIHGAWAKWLGFGGKPVAMQRFYEVHETGGLTLEALAGQVLEKTKALGQTTVGMVGDRKRTTHRIALGTGAITNYSAMAAMGADVLLLTDDGTRLWETAQWASDAEVSLLIVNHATAEEPGMRTLAAYLRDLVRPVPVFQLPVGCLYQSANS
jgi:putative NIF3 family GTP cyclohydrolase 1 type 2